jgi:hypothetical protein
MNHPDSTEHRVQRAEDLVSWTGRERLRFLWYRLRLTISEMNYASRRMVELQMRLPPKWPTVPPPASKKSLPASFLPAWSTAHLSLSIRPVSCLLCAPETGRKCARRARCLLRRSR